MKGTPKTQAAIVNYVFEWLILDYGPIQNQLAEKTKTMVEATESTAAHSQYNEIIIKYHKAPRHFIYLLILLSNAIWTNKWNVISIALPVK